MVNGKTDLVQYYRLVGETEEFKLESDRRLMEDIDNNLVTIDVVREMKLIELFNFAQNNE
jgi:hypothetical protein